MFPRYDWQDAHQLAAKDLSRQRVEHRFSIVALLQPEQRILPELRHNQPFLLGDKDHHRTQRQRGGIGPEDELTLGDIPVAGRAYGRLLEVIFRLRQLRAQAYHLRLFAVYHAVELALNLRLLRHRSFHHRIWAR